MFVRKFQYVPYFITLMWHIFYAFNRYIIASVCLESVHIHRTIHDYSRLFCGRVKEFRSMKHIGGRHQNVHSESRNSQRCPRARYPCYIKSVIMSSVPCYYECTYGRMEYFKNADRSEAKEEGLLPSYQRQYIWELLTGMRMTLSLRLFIGKNIKFVLRRSNKMQI